MTFNLPPFELYDVPATMRGILEDPEFQAAAEDMLRSEVEVSLNAGGRDIFGNTGVFKTPRRVSLTGGIPLYDIGRMMESLTVDTVVDGDALKWSIGFTARSQSGHAYGATHMYGATIPVKSKKQRRMLAAKGYYLRKSTNSLEVPPRNLGFQNTEAGAQGLPMESITKAIDAGLRAVLGS